MRARRTLTLLPLLLVAACQGSGIRGDGPPAGSGRIPDLPGDAIPRHEPRSRYGNGPNYEVFGKHYTVMASGRGYQERGVASWYGKKFHGNLTSNREVYDMYAMTAAHKTLPLPSYVRVRNLVNDRSVVVRVNDRGPFVHNRIIDLSYSAALKLDMINDGTSMVEVTIIDLDAPSGDRPVRRSTPPAPTTAPPLVSLPSVATQPAPTPEPGDAPVDTEKSEHEIFVQVGAFGDRSNAERRLTMLAAAGIDNAFVHEDSSSDPALLRVRIGPVANVVQYDVLVEELANIGITDPYLAAD
ncbi:MAG: septal ring lytic transglycosylase RlpA family protein [Woeseiaceae bacterium]